MALVASNVRVGVTGLVAVAPTTATAPTTTGALPALFLDLGYIDENGLIPKPSRSTKDIKAWQNNQTVRTVATDSKKEYTFTLIETNKDTVEFAYGTTVTQTVAHGTYAADPAATGGRKSFIFDVIDGVNIRREYIAEGELVQMNPSAYSNGDAIAYECTVVAYTVPQVIDTALKS